MGCRSLICIYSGFTHVNKQKSNSRRAQNQLNKANYPKNINIV